ncbi:MAG: alpha-amylase/4-alpha-glucanotransferase domain-containing protein, partial [Candidatus Thorarchaeota archaeon]
MNKIYFPIAFHAHQPIGNFDWVIEDIYEKSYNPLLHVIENHPNIRVDLHISGPLLEWLQTNRDNFLERIARQVKRGVINVIGGGFYEPILAIIPENDRIKQLEMTIDWWQDSYNIKPEGTWLAERVWEPSLVSSLADANIKFIMIDDNHIRSAGYSEKETFQTFITEDQGKEIIVVPINEKIRYLTPWAEVIKTEEYLKSVYDPKVPQLLVSFDDAEKMGHWPGKGRSTFEICYKNGYSGKPWLEEYFQLADSTNWIQSSHIMDFINQHPPHGLIYLPSTSYDKMGIWALPTKYRKQVEDFQIKIKKSKKFSSKETFFLKNFVKGTFWRNFLIKYPEANLMHKRMLYSSMRLKNIIKTSQNNNLQDAYKNILKAQTNDAYWHGMFAGIYFRFLRCNIYKYLILADNIIDNNQDSFQVEKIKYETRNFLKNGSNQIIVSTNFYKAFFDPQKGGTLFELDDMKNKYNWLNTLGRYKEPYHSENSDLIFDVLPKQAFRITIMEREELPKKKQPRMRIIGSAHSESYNTKKNDNTIIFERKEKLSNNTKDIIIEVKKIFSFYEDYFDWNITCTIYKEHENKQSF